MNRQTIELPARVIDDDTAQKLALSGPNTRWLKPLGGETLPDALLGPVQNAPIVYDPAFTSHENSGGQEYATPVSRGMGQILRLLPFTVVWALLAGGAVWLMGVQWQWFLIYFALLTAISYGLMDWNEHKHSRNGLERHKVDSALTVRLTELENSHELRKMALEGYLRHLEGGKRD